MADRRWIVIIALTAAMATACQAGAPASSSAAPPNAASSPVASSFDEYAPAFCAAFRALFRAVGNPDTAEDSELSQALDDAVTAGDGGAADAVAAKVTSELEAGRRHAAFAGGWPPAAPMMREMDRVFVAFEAMTAAKAAAAKAPGSVDPQVVLEQAGGVDAWMAAMMAWPTIADQRPANVPLCDGVPISP